MIVLVCGVWSRALQAHARGAGRAFPCVLEMRVARLGSVLGGAERNGQRGSDGDKRTYGCVLTMRIFDTVSLSCVVLDLRLRRSSI